MKVKEHKYSLIQCITHAFNGFKVMWLSEINFRIHLVIALIVLFAGIVLDLSSLEFVAVLLCIDLVLAAETFNTAIEQICNFISPNINSEIKFIKDTSAGGVLILATISILIGIIIFLPKIYQNIFSI
ncbi:MAG: diacylglycerol kinase family protein [Saprospiraceae bacterium]|nr:diacylglycerol kinase family protein [Saprospiraceae bacterium]